MAVLAFKLLIVNAAFGVVLGSVQPTCGKGLDACDSDQTSLLQTGSMLQPRKDLADAKAVLDHESPDAPYPDIFQSWSDDARPITMSEYQKSQCMRRLGGRAAVHKLLVSDLARIDNFKFPGGKSCFWAWRKDGCGGLPDGKWKSWDGLQGHAFKTMVEKEHRRMKNAGLLQRGGVAIDIGAHSGDTTVPMSLLANKTIAFDPNPKVFEILEANAKLNENIDAHQLAIAPKEGTMTFEYGGLCNGGVAGYGAGGDVHKFKTVNLETFLMQTYGPDIIPKISYIKTDAEGYDSVILESMIPLIKKICERSTCPDIQVEWFAGKRQQLFDAIEKLPSAKWGAFCAQQCTDPSCNPDLPLIKTEPYSVGTDHRCSDLILRAM